MTRFPPCLGGLSKYQLNFSKCIHCIPCVSFNKVVFISPTSTRRPVIFPVYNKNNYFSDFKRKKGDTVYLPDTQVSPETPKLKKRFTISHQALCLTIHVNINFKTFCVPTSTVCSNTARYQYELLVHRLPLFLLCFK